MKTAILGAGAVGGYFGAKLCQAHDDIILVDLPGEHLQAMQTNGIHIRSYQGDFHSYPQTTSNPVEIGPVDLIILSVKAYHTASAIRSGLPMVKESTSILSIQNGLGNEEVIAEIVGKNHVLGGVAFLGATVVEPGVILHDHGGRLVIGELTKEISGRVRGIQQFITKASIPCEISEDIQKDIWYKLAVNASQNIICAITSSTLGESVGFRPTRELFLGIIREICYVAQAHKIQLEDSIEEKIVKLSEDMGDFEGSTVHDLRKKRRTELEALTGMIIKKADEAGIPTPINWTLYCLLSLIEKRTLESN